MCPNLYLWLASPVSTLKKPKVPKSTIEIEHWDSPVPGTYSHVPGRGWFLIHRDGDHPSNKHHYKPEQVLYCRILHRYLLASEMERRCQWHQVIVLEGKQPESDRPTLGRRKSWKPKPEKPEKPRVEHIRFFQLDDGISWVPGWNSKGKFIHGPYRKWTFDQEGKSMRPMEGHDGFSETITMHPTKSEEVSESVTIVVTPSEEAIDES